ncbi:methyltransferase-domain-containing protein [Rhizoctonia solani]|nr:methyltransferase-domain-containing protein [Rhizoctonia solani]
MALFESGWDTKSSNSALVRNSAPSVKPKNGKKDRRDSTTKAGTVLEGNAEGGGTIDLDKLLRKMTDIGGGDVKGKRNDKGKGKGKQEGGRKAKLKEGRSKDDKGGMVPLKPKAGEKQDAGSKDRKKERREVLEAVAGEKRKAEEGEGGSTSKSKKQKKNKKERVQEEQKEANTDSTESKATEPDEENPEEMSELQKLMKKNMQGSKFRIINEKLYKSSSRDAQTMMRSEPQTFTEYHIGFRHQTKSWPSNPVDLISTSLSTLPPRSIIVDLGCGDAQLAKTLVPQGLNVMSFDLLGDNKWVVEADICTRIPLPGSEDAESQGAIADACVCSLSLMSTNWIGCAREAWRVLRMGGRFVVAEVTSRFRDPKEFPKVLSDLGFDLVEQSAPSTHFLLFEFRKVERKGDIQMSWQGIQSSAEGLLKPCEYKRR